MNKSIGTVPLTRVLVYVRPGVVRERADWFTVDPNEVFGVHWTLRKWRSYLRRLGATHWRPALEAP